MWKSNKLITNVEDFTKKIDEFFAELHAHRIAMAYEKVRNDIYNFQIMEFQQTPFGMQQTHKVYTVWWDAKTQMVSAGELDFNNVEKNVN